MAAIMPALLSGIANGARGGILFKGGAVLEFVGKVKAIAFDKTGTLTTGEPQVIDIIAVDGDENQILSVAAAVEVYSEHPIGKAIAQAAKDKNLNLAPVNNVVSHTGFGISGEIKETDIKVGNAKFIQSDSDLPANLVAQSQKLETQGKTIVWVAQSENILGIIAVADTIRPEAATTIQRLKQIGIQNIIVVSGDRQLTTNYIAQQLGISEVYAELLPEDKVTVIRRLKRQYQTVAMVGDGINDAPALATASVGIAMGTTGSDIALETADIVLMADRLEKLVATIHLGRRAIRVIKQNIVFALCSIGLLMVANFTTGINLPLGVIGHEGSTVLVTLSGLRLLRNTKYFQTAN